MREWPFWIRATILIAAYALQYLLWIIWYFSFLWLLLDLLYVSTPQRFNRWLDRYFYPPRAAPVAPSAAKDAPRAARRIGWDSKAP